MAQFMISAFADEAAKDLDGQIAALKRNGLVLIEPRTVINNIIEKTDAEITEIAEKLKEAGISLSALGSPIGKYSIEEPFEPHLAAFERALAACKILGTDRMRIFSFFVPRDRVADYRDEVLRRMQILLQRAKEEGITLCHENEAKIYGQNPEEVADLLTALPELGGVFDAANYIMDAQDPIEGFLATAPSLVYMHVKDAKIDKTIVPVGMGDGKYDEVIRRLETMTDQTVILTVEPHLKSFTGYASIDSREMKHDIHFENSDESFDFAINSLKNLLTSLGYHEENNHVWKK